MLPLCRLCDSEDRRSRAHGAPPRACRCGRPPALYADISGRRSHNHRAQASTSEQKVVFARLRRVPSGTAVRLNMLAEALATAARRPPIRQQESPVSGAFSDGAYRDRTGDLRLAKPALSQLS